MEPKELIVVLYRAFRAYGARAETTIETDLPAISIQSCSYLNGRATLLRRYFYCGATLSCGATLQSRPYLIRAYCGALANGRRGRPPPLGEQRQRQQQHPKFLYLTHCYRHWWSNFFAQPGSGTTTTLLYYCSIVVYYSATKRLYYTTIRQPVLYCIATILYYYTCRWGADFFSRPGGGLMAYGMARQPSGERTRAEMSMLIGRASVATLEQAVEWYRRCGGGGSGGRGLGLWHGEAAQWAAHARRGVEARDAPDV